MVKPIFPSVYNGLLLHHIKRNVISVQLLSLFDAHTILSTSLSRYASQHVLTIAVNIERLSLIFTFCLLHLQPVTPFAWHLKPKHCPLQSWTYRRFTSVHLSRHFSLRRFRIILWFSHTVNKMITHGSESVKKNAGSQIFKQQTSITWFNREGNNENNEELFTNFDWKWKLYVINLSRRKGVTKAGEHWGDDGIQAWARAHGPATADCWQFTPADLTNYFLYYGNLNTKTLFPRIVLVCSINAL